MVFLVDDLAEEYHVLMEFASNLVWYPYLTMVFLDDDLV
eukprot:CAMPEP_0201544812 /NCGR_PEP_ID=MMETSP0173_2-20130828/1434_1 /ASSEMBLY_ACC=CAM_ASM_000268 /TAXON_ID=218659 /ORGANISM="Vexillifera sp., Strain DIVA3 564/2" /LENGTH=38 /DNA_ID= /DNA_START= /DNA_END= /DNA_ORIENTATION=